MRDPAVRTVSWLKNTALRCKTRTWTYKVVNGDSDLINGPFGALYDLSWTSLESGKRPLADMV